jgi:Astacin (Peptidase family M12A)/FG-GAP repeat
MNLTRTLLSCAVLSLGGCALDSADPADPNQPDSSNLLPDGTTGVDHVIRHGTPADLPWTAKHGLKYVSDDFAIGPALAKVAELATPDPSAEWANNIVPFCVTDVANNSLGLTSAERTQLIGYLAELERITPLDFQEFTCTAANKPASYINYIHWNTTPNQTIPGQGHDGWTIDLEYNFWQGDVYHETGHALGYMHEQQRLDRANFVNYYPECVTPVSDRGNFNQNTSTELTPYDIHSIMEYRSTSFATYASDKTTLLCPPLLFGAPNPATAPVWGHYGSTTLRGTIIDQPSEWSAEDINGAYAWYEPKLGAPEQNDALGQHMVSGDFDGDGYDDLAVSAIGEQPGSTFGGAVFLYKGTMNGLVAWTFLDEAQFSSATPRSTDQFGGSLAAGDVDGDGITDLVVGAPFFGASTEGAVFVFKGGRGGLTPLAGPITQSNLGAGTNEADDMFGASVAIGKLYGGSKPYIAVGSPFETPPGASGSRGLVSTFSLSGSTATFKENLHPDQAGIAINNGMFGYALAAGDMNNDGVDDLMVGAPADSIGTGNVAPFFGHTTNMVAGTPLALYNQTLATGDRFGTSLAEAGGELVVGATGRKGPGEVFTFSAFPVGNPSVWVIEMTNEYKQSDIAGEAGHTGDNFGQSVAIGDIDGDSYLDVIVGVPGKPVSGDTAAGEIAIYPRYSAGKVIKPTSPNAEDNFGSSVAVGNFDRGAQSVVHSSTTDLAVGIPDRAVGTATRAGVFNTYKGTTQTLWRQFNEATHNGP